MLVLIFVVILTVINAEYLQGEISFKSIVTKKKYRINFPYDCNSCYIVYLLTCSACLNPNLDGLFRSLFRGGGRGVNYPLSKIR